MLEWSCSAYTAAPPAAPCWNPMELAGTAAQPGIRSHLAPNRFFVCKTHNRAHNNNIIINNNKHNNNNNPNIRSPPHLHLLCPHWRRQRHNTPLPTLLPRHPQQHPLFIQHQVT